MNTPNDITNLYNNLFKLEEKFRKEEAYPIHKRLYFDQNIKDIYEYLVSKIDIKNKVILDAGCGVGFGSLLFAKNGAKSVKGISVSELEIERANNNKFSIENEIITFEKATFDDIQQNVFDLIFCVESLKHSLDFDKSFQTLLNGLKPEGKLCIVDDFFEENENAISKAFMKDWNLNFLLALSHLKLNSEEFEIEIEDLTQWMKPKSLLKINAQILFFKLFKRNAMVKKLFKGGLLLDKLYAKKQMKYLLVVITKNH